MNINPLVFKAYDIRGVVPTQIDEEFALRLGFAFGRAALLAGECEVCVARDGRLSGPALMAALSKGLSLSGVQVLDLGMCTTPMLYFGASTLCKSGIQITGSHNPKDYNGFKMVLAGKALYGDEIQALRTGMLNDLDTDFESFAQKALAPKPIDIVPAYKEAICSTIGLHRPMKIVIDSGNGVAGATAPDIFRQLGCEVIELFSEVDGHFPNHHPDPSKPENLKDLIQAIAKHDAEIAFDGDGDRLGVVTKEGENIFPDRQMQLFAKDVLSRVPGGKIVFDVKCSQRLGPCIKALGGEAVMYKTGHSLIKAKMREIDSPLGGEMSGHIFFKERWFGFDDGTYAGARLLEILSQASHASDVLNALEGSFSTPELNVAIKEGESTKLIQGLIDVVQQKGLPMPEHNPQLMTIDGLRIDWDHGFGLIRASNTTPVLVLRFEGHTSAALESIEKEMLSLLRQVMPHASLTEASH
jgi:phosphomannomutase